MSYVINWCFTLNNYTAQEEEAIKALFPDTAKYIIYGHEVAPETGTPHLQGYIQFKKKIRLNGAKKCISDRAHLEAAKSTPAKNREYCIKGGDFIELGQPSISGSALQGTDGLFQRVMECDTWYDVLNIPGISRHMLFAREVWKYKPPKPQVDVVLRPWQQKLLDMLLLPPDDRTIIWLYDEEGHSGKTFFATYLFRNYGAYVFSPSKGADIYHAYNNQKIIIYDVQRCVDDERINWGVLEKLKDGLIFSGKYDSTMKYREGNAHVIVFANMMPDWTKYSNDRLKVYDPAHDLRAIPRPTYDEII